MVSGVGIGGTAGQVLMIGPSRESRGGIASVVGIWEDAHVFETWGVRYLASHREGGVFAKLAVASAALGRAGVAIVSGRAKCLHVHVARRRSFWRKSLFVFLGRILRCPIVLHLHSGGFEAFYDHECGPLGRWVVRRTLSVSSVIVVLTQRWSGRVSELSGGRRVEVIPNFVVYAGPWKGSGVPGSGARYIAFLGKVGREKGVFDLLDSFALLSARFPDVRLKIAGAGDLDGVEARVHALGLDGSVDILGWVTGEDREALIRGAKAYALPSYYEGMPMGILEAMSRGVPVVATSVGAVPEMVADGVEGFVVEPGDVRALADRLERLVSGVELRRRMGEAGRRRVLKQFTTEVVGKQIDALYEGLGLRMSVGFRG